MTRLQEQDGASPERQFGDAEQRFHDALLKARRAHEHAGELQSAAAQYCRELRQQGHPPEQALRDAKRVIERAIDGDDASVAELAVVSCIKHYYRAD